jgi:hypothetical protein
MPMSEHRSRSLGVVADKVGHAADQLRTLPLVTEREPNTRYLEDSKVLAAIGEWIAPRVQPVSVRLPLELAEAAVAAWNRDETGEIGEETPDQYALRDRAAELALIGLAVSERGRRDGEDVVVDLHATSVAAAMHAAQSPYREGEL